MWSSFVSRVNTTLQDIQRIESLYMNEKRLTIEELLDEILSIYSADLFKLTHRVGRKFRSSIINLLSNWYILMNDCWFTRLMLGENFSIPILSKNQSNCRLMILSCLFYSHGVWGLAEVSYHKYSAMQFMWFSQCFLLLHFRVIP